jgi:hypothetical protein
MKDEMTYRQRWKLSGGFMTINPAVRHFRESADNTAVAVGINVGMLDGIIGKAVGESISLIVKKKVGQNGNSD